MLAAELYNATTFGPVITEHAWKGVRLKDAVQRRCCCKACMPRVYRRPCCVPVGHPLLCARGRARVPRGL